MSTQLTGGGPANAFDKTFPGEGVPIGAFDAGSGNFVKLLVDASGYLKVNVAAGGGAGGTSSTFGAAFPATGTADGFIDNSGNMAGGTLNAAGALLIGAAVGAPVFTTPTPSTTGGWSKVVKAALSTTVATVKGSAGTFGGYFISNPNASVAFVQVFDVSGTVTLGTTVPDCTFGIPANAAANIEIVNGINFANAIKVAATTTATGSSAPSVGLDCTFYFK